MIIQAQFNTKETTDPISFEHEFASRLIVEFPLSTIIVIQGTSNSTIISDAKSIDHQAAIQLKVTQIRDSIPF